MARYCIVGTQSRTVSQGPAALIDFFGAYTGDPSRLLPGQLNALAASVYGSGQACWPVIEPGTTPAWQDRVSVSYNCDPALDQVNGTATNTDKALAPYKVVRKGDVTTEFGNRISAVVGANPLIFNQLFRAINLLKNGTATGPAWNGIVNTIGWFGTAGANRQALNGTIDACVNSQCVAGVDVTQGWPS